MYNRFLENVEFIELIKTRPALWDNNHHLHNDKRICDAIWDGIGERYNISGPAAKSRWKNLRDNFRRELRRSILGLSGSKAEDYNSSWRYFDHMFFIKDHLRQTNKPRPLPFPMVHNQLNFSPTPSTSKQSNGLEEVEIEETTHDAFVKEFPKSDKISPSEEMRQSQLTENMLGSIDPDLGFLAGLLPHIRAVPEQNKAHLKNHLLEVVIQYLSQPEAVEEQVIILDDDTTQTTTSEEIEENVGSPQPSTSGYQKRKSNLKDDHPHKKTVATKNPLGE